MNFRLRLYPAFFVYLLLASGNLAAQSDEEMAAVFNWQFELIAPDSTFIPLAEGNGWEEPTTQAKVICMAAPMPYEQTAADLEALSTEEGQRVLESANTSIGGADGLLLLIEFTPMAGEDTEVTYSLLFARPYRNASLILSAQYPKSEHERLYPRFLRAFSTVRQTQE